MTNTQSFDVTTLMQKDFKAWAYTGLLGIILLYALTRFISPEVNKIAQGGLGGYLFYLMVKNPGGIRRDPMCLLFLGVIIAQVATWVSVEVFHPEISENALKIDRLGKLFLFIPIAWGLKHRLRWVPVVLLVACAGFIADIIFGCDFSTQVGLALEGKRVDFGVRNAQHTSMVFGLMVIMSTLYMVTADKKIKTGGAFVLWTIGLAGLIVTQTRQTFLGLIVASIVVLITSCFLKKISFTKIVISVVMIGALVGTASYSITINQRQNGVWETIKVFIEPLPEDLETAGKNDILAYYISKQDQSTGIRVKLWLAMVPYMTQNPILGWGSSSIEEMIKNTPLLKGERASEIGHLHNYQITLYLCYGLAGVVLINGIYVWLLISGSKSRKQHAHGDKWFLLTVGFVSYWFIINCFENVNGFWPGVFCHNLVLGCVYAHYLVCKNTTAPNFSVKKEVRYAPEKNII